MCVQLWYTGSFMLYECQSVSREGQRDRLPLVLSVSVREKERGALMNAIDLCFDDFTVSEKRGKLMHKQKTRRAGGSAFRRQNGEIV